MSEKVIDFSEVLNRVERKFALLKDDSTQYANAVALMNAYMISLRDLYKPEKADFNHEPDYMIVLAKTMRIFKQQQQNIRHIFMDNYYLIRRKL